MIESIGSFLIILISQRPAKFDVSVVLYLAFQATNQSLFVALNYYVITFQYSGTAKMMIHSLQQLFGFESWMASQIKEERQARKVRPSFSIKYTGPLHSQNIYEPIVFHLFYKLFMGLKSVVMLTG